MLRYRDTRALSAKLSGRKLDFSGQQRTLNNNSAWVQSVKRSRYKAGSQVGGCKKQGSHLALQHSQMNCKTYGTATKTALQHTLSKRIDTRTNIGVIGQRAIQLQPLQCRQMSEGCDRSSEGR